MLNIFSTKEKTKVKSSFVDLSSEEQKDVITKAAREASKEQTELIEKAEKMHCAEC